MGLPYVCQNDECKNYMVKVGVPREMPADCQSCGWTMVAVGR